LPSISVYSQGIGCQSKLYLWVFLAMQPNIIRLLDHSLD
jgi:hypothetical protein